MAEDEYHAEPWILAVVTAMGWNGTDVTFQEFSSRARCEYAADLLSKALDKSGGGLQWQIEIFPK